MLYYDNVTINNITYLLAADNMGLVYVGQLGAPKLSIDHFYPDTLFKWNSALLAPYASELTEFFSKKRTKFDLPLNLEATCTPWQQQVLAQVSQIDYGQTVSYGEIANMLNRPQAVRAVAHAIANNPILFFIPCHRIIRANGKFGQYRLGNSVKKELINLEKSF
ncbi:methylated-DNA--[protein]-cysteine S-methyltransferase [Lactobacillus sp. ESL0684]|uniref:methylated-DNA--[protein]-cysteine S-methyltransferase n=1 Tax=Lactobacillus sp. ESL0684 TaxID=2983213 RepID=UPI0023F9E03E|nr:methylated-DNA--[protein]-cysteine S-methyltransferase [Lactobacillus sp. ESL0684]WEV43544.1 methylated-DNA--[protein]-cysteine S-methyltransferase [Lactobacillus sp. ESL0684]